MHYVTLLWKVTSCFSLFVLLFHSAAFNIIRQTQVIDKVFSYVNNIIHFVEKDKRAKLVPWLFYIYDFFTTLIKH